MTTPYRRTEPGRRENLAAGAVALAVGSGVAAVAFYLARILLSRERLRTGADVAVVESSDADHG